jgi:hypothetical protein
MLVDDDSRSMTRMLDHDSLHDLDGLASDDSGAGGNGAAGSCLPDNATSGPASMSLGT